MCLSMLPLLSLLSHLCPHPAAELVIFLMAQPPSLPAPQILLRGTLPPLVGMPLLPQLLILLILLVQLTLLVLAPLAALLLLLLLRPWPCAAPPASTCS